MRIATLTRDGADLENDAWLMRVLDERDAGRQHGEDVQDALADVLEAVPRAGGYEHCGALIDSLAVVANPELASPGQHRQRLFRTGMAVGRRATTGLVPLFDDADLRCARRLTRMKDGRRSRSPSHWLALGARDDHPHIVA